MAPTKGSSILDPQYAARGKYVYLCLYELTLLNATMMIYVLEAVVAISDNSTAAVVVAISNNSTAAVVVAISNNSTSMYCAVIRSA